MQIILVLHFSKKSVLIILVWAQICGNGDTIPSRAELYMASSIVHMFDNPWNLFRKMCTCKMWVLFRLGRHEVPLCLTRPGTPHCAVYIVIRCCIPLGVTVMNMMGQLQIPLHDDESPSNVLYYPFIRYSICRLSTLLIRYLNPPTRILPWKSIAPRQTYSLPATGCPSGTK